MTEFDYVIVGSGSAGSVLAYRLTENDQNSTCVLEYGGVGLGTADPDAGGPLLSDEHGAI